MNPEKMRDTYGKLMYLLQDSKMPEVKEMLQFSCVREIQTVYRVLDANNCLALLKDDMISVATREIVPQGKTRYQIQSEIKAKERAIEHMAARYARGDVSPELIKQCLYSIGDNHAFLRVNRDPCDRMIGNLMHLILQSIYKNSLVPIESSLDTHSRFNLEEKVHVSRTITKNNIIMLTNLLLSGAKCSTVSFKTRVSDSRNVYALGTGGTGSFG